MSATIVNCLGGLLSADSAVRTSAEEYLHKLEAAPGYCPELARLIPSSGIQMPIRHMACIVLKNYAKEHWSRHSEKFQEPEVSPEDKAAVRATLPIGLADPDTKIRTAVALAVAAIAHWDWPEQWPTVIPDLLRCLRETGSPHLVHGAVRCLELFVCCENVDEDTLPQLTALLLDDLLRVFLAVDRRSQVAVLCACRAIAMLCTKINVAPLMGVMPGVLCGLSALLSATSDDVLLLLLDTVGIVTRCSTREVVAACEPTVTPPLLAAWASRPGDAIVSTEVVEIFKDMARAAPECVAGLMSRLAPAVHGLLSEPARAPALVSAAVDMLALLVISVAEPDEQQTAAFNDLFRLLLQTVCTTDDNEARARTSTAASTLLAGIGASCLRAYIYRFGERLLEWKTVDGRPSLQHVLPFITRLLSEEGTRGACVGPLVGALIERFPSQIGAVLEPILGGILHRLADADDPGFILPLVMVFVRLVHSHREWVLDFLARSSALPLVAELWTRNHAGLRSFGGFQVKESAVALCKLLETPDPRLEVLRVSGARVQGSLDKRTSVPLMNRVVSILCAEYMNADWERHIATAPGNADADDAGDGEAAGAEGAADSAEDIEEDEDDYNGLTEEEVMRKLGCTDGDVFAPADEFEELQDEDGDEEEPEDEDLPFVQGTPLFRVDLKTYLEGFFAALIAQQAPRLHAIYMELGPEDQAVINQLFGKARAASAAGAAAAVSAAASAAAPQQQP
eukprot:m51a1_g7290 putative importin-9 isoform x1 (739) ;mRNA; f:49826-52550